MINVGLIAHDGKKPEMVSFVVANKAFLSKTKIFATGTTGGHISKEGFDVECLLSGPKGGDAQIAALLATGHIDVVIFFRDPLDKHPHEPDVQMLMRLCDVHNIPLATNPKTAFYILKGFEVELAKEERKKLRQ
jgi:methylglyoxal synthase